MKFFHRRFVLVGLALVLALLVMSACSSPTIGTGSGNGTPASSLTVLQVLQNSANAMKQVKTVHFDTTNSGTVTGSNGTSGTTGATPTAGSGSFNLTGNGDVVVPDQQSVKVTLNQNTNLAEIVQGNKIYVQNTRGQWYVLDKSTFQGLATNPLAGTSLPDMNSWLGLIQNVQLTDHGTEAISGVNLRHITAALDKTSLQQLLTSNDQVKSFLGSANISAVLNATKSLNSTLDVWINETNSYVYKTELKFNLNADLSSLATATSTTGVQLPSNATVNFDSVVNLSNFNKSVTITPPANAIPTSNPAVIFG